MRSTRGAVQAGPQVGGPAFISTDSVPAPIGGWDTLSPIAQMPPDHAVVLDNWIPRPGYIEVRRGSNLFVTASISSATETLMAYNAPNTTNSKLFAAIGSVIFDITSGSTASSQTGLTSARWQTTNFTNAAGTHYLYIVNGADTERAWNGSAWALFSVIGSAGITGYTAGTLVHVADHKGRLWFVQNNSSAALYMPVASSSGALTSFELGEFMTKGGYLNAVASWSVDTRQTVDDYLAFISSRGQLIVYQGTDPSSATTWALVGVYDVGSPIGRRCFLKVAGDLFLLTMDGILPMSQMLSTDRAAANRVSLTSMIMDTWRQSANNYSGNFGWQFISYPKGTLAIANIPTASDGAAYQYVMNTLTGAWCRFTGVNAICWEIFNDNIFYGTAGGVAYQFDQDAADGSTAITATMQSAFNYFGKRGYRKRFTMIRPLITTDHNVIPGVGLNVDFGTNGQAGSPVFSGLPGALWDTATWDTSTWPGEMVTTAGWQSLDGEGFCGSVIVSAITSKVGVSTGVLLRMNGFDVMMEPGGPL